MLDTSSSGGSQGGEDGGKKPPSRKEEFLKSLESRSQNVAITTQQILAAVTAGGETQIGTSPYSVKCSGGSSLGLYHTQMGKIGQAHLIIKPPKLTIDTIDSNADLQGGGLGRLLLACVCVYGQSLGATTMSLTDNITNTSYWQAQLNTATGGNVGHGTALIANLISHWGNLQVALTPNTKLVDLEEQQKKKGYS